MKTMLTVEETVKVLVPFYSDCVAFWKREGYSEIDAKEKALYDIESLCCNPYEPNGAWINQEAKNCFIEFFENL